MAVIYDRDNGLAEKFGITLRVVPGTNEVEAQSASALYNACRLFVDASEMRLRYPNVDANDTAVMNGVLRVLAGVPEQNGIQLEPKW